MPEEVFHFTEVLHKTYCINTYMWALVNNLPETIVCTLCNVTTDSCILIEAFDLK